jgi:hypothetical protein
MPYDASWLLKKKEYTCVFQKLIFMKTFPVSLFN